VLVEVAEQASTLTACRLLGVSRATHYRRRAPKLGPARRPGGGVQPTALSGPEREQVLQILNGDRFADKSPAQAWAVLLDEGCYMGSISTFYRVLRSADQVRERRAQARHPARVRPELVATGPDQVWTWDITKLKGPSRGVYYDLYVIIDIYSRKVMHWQCHTTETGLLAKEFIAGAIAANKGTMPSTIHSDNGTSMTSKNVAALLADLHIERSLSRPHTSNDNPYSEAAFKTLKYCPAFPEIFTSIYDARDFARIFFRYYNLEHRHSGIGLYTPASVHDGSWQDIRDHRQKTMDEAWTLHPERFHRGRPQAPQLPTRAWTNQPPSTIEADQELQKTATD
jgi:putative transposase